ncbi:MAG: hypothetical protein CVU11_13620 [Bacteroidetes bacterium HGW-Bacteroidetes-6]|jgi:hypothetical protein|nr:MAG: hypothetical protein CVU11_13620 [Bacteroidetes bacterium HGW-Bacteroidetes-6]
MKKNFIYVVFLGLLAVFTLSLNSCGNQKADSDDTEVTDDSNNDSDDARAEDEDYYVSKDGKFKVKFPGTPEVSSQMVPTDAGEIEMFTYIYEKSATEAYMVAYGDYPSSLIDGSDPKELLEASRDGALETSKIDGNEDLKVNGFPAIRTRAIDVEQNFYYIYEVILAKNRLYQVMIVRDGDYPSDSVVADFIDDFVITMKKK